MDEIFWRSLPPELDTAFYRSLYTDLARFTDDQLADHYQRYGREEGRIANPIKDRNAFAALVPRPATVLEIGPFCHPLLRGANVFYSDVLSTEELISRGKELGLDPAEIPYIHYVCSTGDVSAIDRKFDVVINSHCIEHQPDLVRHLKQMEEILLPGGAYFLLVPDKRYCFDHFIPVSNLAEVLVAYRERRTIHSLRSVIEHRALTTHNDSERHWRGDHGLRSEGLKGRIEAAIREYEDAQGIYIDVHAWYFTPENFSSIISGLRELGLNSFEVHRAYPTRRPANEFWMILRSQGSAET